MALFTLFFGSAIYFRRNAARHKRLMFLTALNFMPPAIGRLPLAFVQANPAAWGLGLPTGLALTGLALDAFRHRRVDGVFLGAALLLILSFPARIALMATPVWGRSSAWLASLVD